MSSRNLSTGPDDQQSKTDMTDSRHSSLGGGDLGSIPPGVESLALSESMQHARSAFATLAGLCVSPPFDLDANPLDGEEHDDGRNGNGCRERGGQYKVVLG